jgi:hypothetical protein
MKNVTDHTAIVTSSHEQAVSQKAPTRCLKANLLDEEFVLYFFVDNVTLSCSTFDGKGNEPPSATNHYGGEDYILHHYHYY